MAEDYPNEQWRPVVGYEGWYEVSDCGRVKRIKKSSGARPGRIFSLIQTHDGYSRALLHLSGVRARSHPVHRLVMAAFLRPCPAGLQVNHKNGDKLDNRLCNLEYVTHKENMRHAREVLGIKMGPVGESHPLAKLTDSAVRDIRHRYGRGDVILKRLAAEYGVSIQTVASAIKRKTWRHVGV